MKLVSRLSFCALLIFLVQSTASNALAQQKETVGNFQGEWSYVELPRSRSELPPAYKDMKLSDVPRYSLGLTIKQKGRKLTGTVGATANYLARLEEDSEFDTTAQGDTALIELTSGFGGKATARITVRGDRLYWKIIKSEGEHYFRDTVVLHRTKGRRRR